MHPLRILGLLAVALCAHSLPLALDDNTTAPPPPYWQDDPNLTPSPSPVYLHAKDMLCTVAPTSPRPQLVCYNIPNLQYVRFDPVTDCTEDLSSCSTSL
jgi:hypothetical protein